MALCLKGVALAENHAAEVVAEAFYFFGVGGVAQS
jgi:hypothetical protein